jgi:BMFP domain-containing protein YqiC
MDMQLDGVDHVQEDVHQAFNIRMEDVEKDVQVVKGDINNIKIRMDFLHWDIGDNNNSIDNLNIWKDQIYDCVEGLAQSIQSNTKVSSSMVKASLLEAQQVEKELRPVIKGWFGKLEQNNTIINRKFIHLDEGLDKVMALVEEKIQSRMEDLSSKFSETLEVDGVRLGPHPTN